MLKGIDPLLNAELLHSLAAMGHGDEIVVADANFPAASLAQRLIRLDGVSATRAMQAIVSILPLDDFVDEPCAVMAVACDATEEPETVREFRAVANAVEGRAVGFESVERFAFYARVRAAFAVVATGETRLYGNVILVKGVIRGS